MAIVRGQSFIKKVEALKAKGFGQKRAESFASQNTLARYVRAPMRGGRK